MQVNNYLNNSTKSESYRSCLHERKYNYIPVLYKVGLVFNGQTPCTVSKNHLKSVCHSPF